ncbi:MAG: hypothetical protein IE937_05010 [Gammaproteobacteria bacterium]|nr:hypothetical protein [Gammaproteobacteria bacterium]
MPDGQAVPAHFHITDVGSVFRHFIDCGGQIGDEAYVQIQLWLGADSAHRLTAQTAGKILQQSQPVLARLPDLARSEVMVEYQTTLTSLYAIDVVRVTTDALLFALSAVQTQCLAALRHERDKVSGRAAACCAQGTCCG